MKKLLFGFLASLLLLSADVFAQDAPFIQLEFGRKSKNCAGIGICVLKINASLKNVVELINAVSSNGRIKTSFTPAFYEKNKHHFQDNHIVLEEDYVIDRKTTQAIGVADNYTIKTGKYPVVFDKATNTYNCAF